MIDWAEKAGLENLRYHLQSADHLIKEANTTLTILFTGAGAALAFALKGLELPKVSSVAYASAGLSVFLFFLAGLVVWKCIWIGDMPMPTNSPMNLFQPDYELNTLRKVELRNIDARIEQAAQRNLKTATWLNGLRAFAIVGTPLIGITFFLAAARLSG